LPAHLTERNLDGIQEEGRGYATGPLRRYYEETSGIGFAILMPYNFSALDRCGHFMECIFRTLSLPDEVVYLVPQVGFQFGANSILKSPAALHSPAPFRDGAIEVEGGA
jgi:hypothetical protein